MRWVVISALCLGLLSTGALAEDAFSAASAVNNAGWHWRNPNNPLPSNPQLVACEEHKNYLESLLVLEAQELHVANAEIASLKARLARRHRR